ncbi:MAG: D-2-hydroxyacid dehydrogenase [Armatimonadota bacterium]
MTDVTLPAAASSGSASSADSDSPRLTLWCNAGFHGTALSLLQEGTARYDLVLDGTKESLAQADIAFGQPDENVVIGSDRLRWAQISSAGYTRYDRDDVRAALQARGAMLTNSSHVFDEPCAQHAFAFMLALARQIPQALVHQQTDRAWKGGPLRAQSFLLNGQTVVFLGYGAIAKRLAALLAPLDMRVIALRRSSPQSDDSGVTQIGEDGLADALAQADHVMNLLPESPSTLGYVTAERLAQCRPGAFFYNIGRGATVDQTALRTALESGQIGAAYLDVTTPEPLPPSDPVWSAPNCFITPHSAGGHIGESERLVRHFLNNLAAWEKSEPLLDRVI